MQCTFKTSHVDSIIGSANISARMWHGYITLYPNIMHQSRVTWNLVALRISLEEFVLSKFAKFTNFHSFDYFYLFFEQHTSYHPHRFVEAHQNNNNNNNKFLLRMTWHMPSWKCIKIYKWDVYAYNTSNDDQSCFDFRISIRDIDIVPRGLHSRVEVMVLKWIFSCGILTNVMMTRAQKKFMERHRTKESKARLMQLMQHWHVHEALITKIWDTLEESPW